MKGKKNKGFVKDIIRMDAQHVKRYALLKPFMQHLLRLNKGLRLRAKPFITNRCIKMFKNLIF